MGFERIFAFTALIKAAILRKVVEEWRVTVVEVRCLIFRRELRRINLR